MSIPVVAPVTVMGMDVASFLLSPTVFVAVFAGASAILLVYILSLFRNGQVVEENARREPVSAPEKKAAKSKKKPSASNSSAVSSTSTATTQTSFTSPWLLKTLKSHTGQILHVDYSSNGKYLASCAEGTLPPPSPSTPSPPSSGVTLLLCPEEDPPDPPPKMMEPTFPRKPGPPGKGLTRRQRKNRRREDSPPDPKKRTQNAVPEPSQLPPQPRSIKFQYRVPMHWFANLLYPHLLTYEQQFAMGYPGQGNNGAVFFDSGVFAKKNFENNFDVNTRMFVPRRREDDGQQSDDSCEEVPFWGMKKAQDQGIQRCCVRCNRGFFVTKNEYLTQERCTYHWGKLRTEKERGYTYSCCHGRPGSPGCTTCKLHVWSGVVPGLNGPFDGYVKTIHKRTPPINGQYGVYALDCEMCYTVAGLEVAKVTVVEPDGNLVYESYVKPLNEVVDYNTRFSGITSKDLKSNNTRSLREVQSDLRRFIYAETILIGHGLENDLRALKIIHRSVVDTALSFPHYNGLPYKRSLKNLVLCELKRDVQCSSSGHDSYEDACSCMELMLCKITSENRDLFV